ncbi:hypothetical protein H310_03755 [Aphanomyces invadans]|uniref:VOC domain-containing protein n=1 Tax=Aphanomyces invadans TaxID=157072 RepID=A0A024UIQ2_9STRA|nr:hypothetical protein H310_03755 [Aphanomyces invadans]ETW06179.1 hypothetical protein H310_03755 [Aphanomyces invadans]|eukprot:XP_008865956.1 hypothetical protein H310_03755 [Aphanomyces invadans]
MTAVRGLTRARWFSSTTRGILGRRPPALDHVCLVVKDVHKSVRFYEELLGAEHMYKHDKNFGYNPAFLRVGSAQVALLPLEPTQTPIRDHNGAHFAITCADEADFLEIKGRLPDDLKRAGGPNVSVDFFDYDRQWSLFFHDLDNNIVEIAHWRKR